MFPLDFQLISLSELARSASHVAALVRFHGALGAPEGDEIVLTPVWQSSRWGKMLVSTGHVKEVFVALARDTPEDISVVTYIEIRSIGLGLRAGYCIGGPLLRPSGTRDSSILQEFLRRLRAHRDLADCVFIQFEPLIQSSDLSGLGLVPLSPHARYLLESTTRLIDLSQSEIEILAGMRQKGRYNIRIAEKSWVVVSHAPPTGENIDIFYALLSDTLDRNHFSGNSRAYYEALLLARTAAGEGLYFASYEGEVIAAAILVIEGNTAVYYYGASTSDNVLRAHMPAYLLQWEMMRSAQALGVKWYDFLGIAPLADPESHLTSVSEFKAKFGGQIYEAPAKYQLVLKPWILRIYELVRAVKRIFSRRH